MLDYLRLLTEDEIVDPEIRAFFERRNRLIAASLYRQEKQIAAREKQIESFEVNQQAFIKNWQIQYSL